MKKGLFLIGLPLLLFGVATCARKEEPAPAETAEVPALEASPSPAAVGAAETTHPFRGKIVSRDPAKNEVTMDGEKVEGVMEAMSMAYEVRGANVETLPADGSTIQATLHAQDGRYWLTDITAE